MHASFGAAPDGTPREARHLAALDGLRGLLALYVVVYHFILGFPDLHRAVTGVTHLFGHAWLSVDIFFALSGFVLMHVYGPSFAAGLRAAEVRAFLIARVARLYPLHLAMLAALVPLAALKLAQGETAAVAADGFFSWRLFLANLLMLHGPEARHEGWSYPAWSISVEMHLYVAFPVLAFLAARLAGRPRVLAGLVLAGPALAMLAYAHHGEDPWIVGLPALGRGIAGFTCGMALHLVFDRIAPRVRARLPALALVSLAVLLPALHGRALAPEAALLMPLAIAGVLASQGRFSGRFWQLPPLLWLGAHSYSIYMIHAVVQLYLLGLVRGAATFTGAPQLPLLAGYAALGLAATLILAALSKRWLEDPARTLIRTWAAPQASPDPQHVRAG